MKKVLILKGSPRKNGNTNALTAVVEETLRGLGAEIRSFDLYDLNLKPCLACRGCQTDWSAPNCVQQDDMQQIFEAVLESDLILVASPIYSWYCTPPTKMVMDRLVYAMNKYYGEKQGPSIWKGRQLALITSCGYKPKNGADLWEEGMKRYCRHSGLVYEGMLAERHLGYNVPFMDEDKEQRAREFARSLMQEKNV